MPFFDGTSQRIYYRIWEVDDPVATLLFLHGGGEHSGQYSRLAAGLNARGVDVWIPDHQGHGISGGAPGDVDDIATLVADATHVADLIAARAPKLPVVIGGHSLGSATAAAALVAEPSRYAGGILVGWRGARSFDETPLVAAADGSYHFDTSRLAADPDYVEELVKDPLVHLQLPHAATLFDALQRAAAETAERFGALTLPLLLINGAREAAAVLANGRHWAEELDNVELLEIAGGLHNVVNDVDYRQVTRAIGDFVLTAAAALPA